MLTDPLLLTILIEGVTLLLLGNRDWVFYLYWCAVTTLTNIPANLCLNFLSLDSKVTLFLAVFVIELLVFAAELLLGFLYTRNIRLSAKYSAVCNLASFGIGSFIRMIILS